MAAGYPHLVNHPSTVSLTIQQKKTLNSLVKSTSKKDEYRKYLAVLRKSEGRTYLEISKEYEISRADRYKDGLLPISRKE